jgi:hypothetical protein
MTPAQTAAPPPADPVAALAAEHGYPPEVEAVLRRVVDALRPLAPRALLLHGSAARGELSWWREEGGRVRLGSDVELYVVGDAPFAAEARERADRALRALAAEVNDGGDPLFHVDTGYTTPAGLARHPRTFRSWDARATGRTLLGDDARPLLPALGAADIDLRQLNEVPIHRLWEMAFRAPRALVEEGGAAAAEERRFAFVCARQALDLTTWLLPHCGVLVPGFRARVDEWERLLPETALGRYFTPASAGFLRECLQGKLELRFRRGARELHAEVLEHFRAGLRMVLGLAPGAGDDALAAAVLSRGRRHWHGEPPRRLAYDAWLLLRDRPAPGRALRWWGRARRPLQVAALLRLNAALAALLAGTDPEAPLAEAEALVARLWYGFRPAGGSPAARWLAARRAYVEYLAGTSRWFAPRRDYLLAVLGERAAADNDAARGECAPA